MTDSSASMLPWAVGLVTLLSVVFLGLAAASADPIARRARRLATGEGVLPAEREPLRDRLLARAHLLLRDLAVRDGPARRNLVSQLAEAGYRGNEAMVALTAGTLVAPTLGGLLGWILAPALLDSSAIPVRLVLAAAGVVLGLMAPRIWLRNAVIKRRQRLLAQLPLGLDLMVICAEAGLALDAAMARVGRELHGAAPDMADELAFTAIELGFLPDRGEAFRNLVARTGLEETRALVAILSQTERYGTPLASALRILADEVREAAMLRAEERAARLPAMLTVPLIVFVLPPLFIVLIGPAVLQLLAAG
ncbi:MAG: type II secretion system F family protein [Thermaurantiacus sp.]